MALLFDWRGLTQRPAQLGAELGAAFTAPCGQNRATGTGSHSSPKSVGLSSTPVVRLKGALAHKNLPKISVKQTLKPYAMASRGVKPRLGYPQTCQCLSTGATVVGKSVDNALEDFSDGVRALSALAKPLIASFTGQPHQPSPKGTF